MLNYIDRNLDFSRLSNYRLSIQIDLNGFSFCVFDRESGRHLAVKSHPYTRNISSMDDLVREANKVLTSQELLATASCNCIFESLAYTLIPKEFFEEQYLFRYIGFVSPIDELDEIHYRYLEELDSYLIYLVPSSILSLFKTFYKNINIHNQLYPLLKIASAGSGLRVNINVNRSSFDLVLFNEKELLLQNSYDYYSFDDILYFLGSIVKEFHLSQKIKGSITGNISGEDIYSMNKYFPNISQVYNERMSLLLGKENSSLVNNLLYMAECE